MNNILAQLGEMGVIPVVAVQDAADSPALAQALLDGGLPCVEITFRTAAAAAAIRLISDNFPTMLVGAGTVLTVDQARTAVAAGARFIVSPGLDPAVVDWCLAEDVAVTPGVVTPTEISLALKKGLKVLKFFPAEALGGVKTLKAIGGPFTDVRFIPTGGINLDNLGDYLSLPTVHACGGSWLAKKSLIAAGDFATITRLTREAVTKVSEYRAIKAQQ
jgi:2-dehydro-3-deoxyphosphogluconate aldolase/(4S)-4-hydroxy-2-oxoglutarate aldolase